MLHEPLHINKNHYAQLYYTQTEGARTKKLLLQLLVGKKNKIIENVNMKCISVFFGNAFSLFFKWIFAFFCFKF